MKKFFFLFLFFFSGCVFPWQKSSEEITRSAIQSFLSLDSFHAVSDLRFTPEQGLLSRSSSVHFDASFATRTEQRSFFGSGNFLYTTLLGNADTRLGGDFVRFDNVSYVKLNELPTFGFFDTSSLREQWWRVDDDFSRVTKLLNSSGAFVFFEAYSASSLETKQTIEDLLVKGDFFTIEQELPREKIHDTKIWHYRLGLKKSEVQNFWIDALALLAKDPAAAPFLQEYAFSDSIQAITFDTIDFWIGAKDQLLHKISLTGSFPTKLTEKPTTFSGEIFFDNFHKPVDVSAPESAKSFSEFFSQKVSL